MWAACDPSRLILNARHGCELLDSPDDCAGLASRGNSSFFFDKRRGRSYSSFPFLIVSELNSPGGIIKCIFICLFQIIDNGGVNSNGRG